MPLKKQKPEKEIRSGNEAAALAVLHSAVDAAYAYPGTPSTEIMAILRKRHKKAFWCANEKTSLEAALGVSYAGGRAFASMKHVGLNAAADPFMSGANVKINGGLVVVVADDPGMHSSQNEQDSRYYADFARVPCFEPADIQETYDMIREAFWVSEKLNKIVLVRMCTRLSHSKGQLTVREEDAPVQKAVAVPQEWNVIPAFGKRNWKRVVDSYPVLEKMSEDSPYNCNNVTKSKKGVITTGIAREYFLETGMAGVKHLHIGFYPLPVEKIRDFVDELEEAYVIEEGYPYLERYLRGIIPPKLKIMGKMDGTFNAIGELTPDIVAAGLGLAKEKKGPDIVFENLPARPPQLCRGCPHADSFGFVRDAIKDRDDVVINSDIGCYSLGSLPPFSLPITLVDMGASIPMAKGGADLGKAAIAIIGDSTFLHSGMTGLADCVADNTPVTVIILDNHTTAMTGGQPQLLPSERIPEICRGIGVDPAHVIELKPLASLHEENTATLKREMAYPGVSVIITRRECIETARKKAKEARA